MVKQNNPSRFSSLKVFNFTNQSSSKSLYANDNHDHNNYAADQEPPPPPPPKDRYYLYNRSMSSLTPDSYSMPSTPLSPGFGRPALPSQSTTDLSMSEFGGGGGIGQRVSPLSSTSGKSTGASGSGSSGKKGFFGKLAARNNSRKNSKVTPVASSESGEDEGISAPWNFQVRLCFVLDSLIC